MKRRSNCKVVPRTQTADEIAEVFSVTVETVRKWVKASCPHRRGKGNQIFLNDGEIRVWLDSQGRVDLNPGRPPKPKPENESEDKDYWLARKYKIQALEAEGELIPRDVVKQMGAGAFGTFRNQCAGLAPKLAVLLEGLNASEREDVIRAELAHFLDGLSRHLRQLGGSDGTAAAA